MRLRIFFVLLLLLFITQPVFAAKPVPSPTPTPTPVSKSVCLDVGHGGTDSGATYLDLKEKDVNLQVALNLQNQLQSAGYMVYMTRTNDVTLSNANRYNYCNSTGASILISIHQNGSTDPTIDYTEALYGSRSQDKPLAIIVANTVSAALGLPNHGVTNFASGVLLKSNMPSAISEALFITSQSEYNGIKDGTRVNQEATALFSAIQSYLGN